MNAGFWCGAAALLLAGAVNNSHANSGTAAPAMQLALAKLDGGAIVRLADFSGRAVLLNFWASDCVPCIREMPMLDGQAAVQRQVDFVGIATDAPENARRFLQGQPMSYPQLAAGKPAAALLRRFGNRIGALPYTVMLTPEHRICAMRLGAVNTGWLAAAVQACAPAKRVPQ